MSRNHRITVSVVVTLLAADACIAQSRRERRDRDRNGGVERSTPSTQATTQSSAGGRTGAMDDQFKVLLERSIFARSGVAARVDRPSTSTAPVAPPLSPEQAVVFVGVMAQDNEYVAFAENQVTRQLLILRTGDDVARGKVVGINLDTMAYGSGGTIKEVHLGQNLAGELASTSFASGAAPTTSPAGAPGSAPSAPLSSVEAAMRARRARGE